MRVTPKSAKLEAAAAIKRVRLVLSQKRCSKLRSEGVEAATGSTTAEGASEKISCADAWQVMPHAVTSIADTKTNRRPIGPALRGGPLSRAIGTPAKIDYFVPAMA